MRVFITDMKDEVSLFIFISLLLKIYDGSNIDEGC